MKKASLFAIISLLYLGLSVKAGTIVPYLNDSDAVFATNAATKNAATPAVTLANGLTLAAQITPDANDLTSSSTGAVQVLELGGTSNGSGLWIINGNITFLSKFNAASAYPASTADSDGSDGVLAYSFGSLTAGVSYDIWASLDSANSALTLSLNGTITQVALSNVSGTWNWAGNGGIDFGNPLDVAGRLGGLSDNTGAGLFYRGNAVGLDDVASLGQIFNQVVAVPEPSAVAMFGMGVMVLIWQLRRRPGPATGRSNFKATRGK